MKVLTQHAVARRAQLRRLVGVAAVSLVLATAVPGLAASAGLRPHAPTVLSVGEYPGESPNYIFPFTSCAHYDVANVQDFQELMYRPLYWFGLGASTAEQPALSLANPPVFSATTVKITLKGWKFADGSTVDAGSVEFFLNLWKAEASQFCGTSAGMGIPGQITDVTGAPSGNVVVIQVTKTADLSSTGARTWLLDDYLSQVTPLPTTWDTAGGCAEPGYNSASTLAACASDFSTLDARANDDTTYGGAFWNAGVDGPYRLSAYAAGTATLVPNAAYSGPQKAQLSVRELAYTSMSAELADLEAAKLQLGYVDPSALPSASPSPGTAGANLPSLAAHYELKTDVPWEYDSVLYNFGGADPMAPVLSQAYVREALTSAVSLPGMIKTVLKGYGLPTCSSNPPHTPAALSATVPCSYPSSVAKATSLLQAHGWTLSGGVMTCTSPGTAAGECGAGIPSARQLRLTIDVASGVPSVSNATNVLVSDLDAIGVDLTVTSASYDQVHQQCGGATFELCWWGDGQLYARSVYPSGDQIYATGGAANLGGYSNAALDASITASHRGTLTKYATLVGQTVPSLFMPDQVLTQEVATSLKSADAAATVPNPFEDFLPEYLSYGAPPPPAPRCQGKGSCDVAAASPQVICLIAIGCGTHGLRSVDGARSTGPCGALDTTTSCVAVTTFTNGKPSPGKHVTVKFLSASTPNSTTGSWCEPQGSSPPVTTVSGTSNSHGVFYFPYTTTGTVAPAEISSFCMMRATVGRASIIMAIDETNDPGPYKIKAAPRHMTRFAIGRYHASVKVTVNNPSVSPPNGVRSDPTAIISEVPSTVGACGAVKAPLVKLTGTTGKAVLIYIPSTIYGTRKHPATCTVVAQEAETSSTSNKVVITQIKP